jgi:mono/diheme cytochrome c family protein
VAAGLGIVAGTALLSGCRSTPALTVQQADGKHLYAVRCAHCHDDNDLALKKIPPDLHGVFKRSALPSGAPATDAEVRRVVLAGKGMMPGFAGRFTQEQMTELLAYLHTVFVDSPGYLAAAPDGTRFLCPL